MNEKQDIIDRDLLIRLDEKVGLFLTEFKTFTLQIDNRLKTIEAEKASSIVQKDHETRLRRAEYFLWLGLGIVIALQFYFNVFRK